ncbi:rCG41050, partial [Rattus norvegicus]
MQSAATRGLLVYHCPFLNCDYKLSMLSSIY